MDCCRSSKRLGGVDIKVMARKSRPYFKASPWELEDAEEELVEILVNHSPKSFLLENGKLAGMEFEIVSWAEDENGRLRSTVHDTVEIPCDDVILAIGQDNAFPWIERDIGIEFGEWDMPVVDRVTFQTTRDGVFVGWGRGVGAGEHHLGRRARHIRRPSPSTTTARTSPLQNGCPTTRTWSPRRWGCTSGPTPTTTIRPLGRRCSTSSS